MPSCSIINCGNTTKPPRDDRDISFHRFPDDPFVKDLWIKATGRKNWSPSKHSRICSMHFVDHMFTCNTGVAITKYRRLCSDAVPTIDVVKISTDDQVNFTPNCRTFKLVPVPSTSKTPSSSSEDSSSETEIERVLIKEEREDNEYENENQLIEGETVKKKPKLDEKKTIERTETHAHLPETCNNVECCDDDNATVLIPEAFMNTLFQAQTDVLNTLKSQVLLQHPDPQLFTFLRILGAKLQMMPVHNRRIFQDKVTALILQEYFDG